MDALGIYIHIPFCVRKCSYCDFLSGPASADTQKRYVEQLLTEIEQKKEIVRNRRTETIFFGGGTPSVVAPELIGAILEKLREVMNLSENAEISIEANPGTIDREKLEKYRSYGINRLSLGLQSADNEELKKLGRIHTWEEFLENYSLARECGFENINIDLMSALPGQTEKTWEETLRKVIALSPEHISAYSLIIEEGTPFYEKYENHPELLPDEDAEREMYYRTKTILKEAGYDRYEISNYAKPGFVCRHNLSYWDRRDYLGLGLGAASLVSEVRSSNQTELAGYLAGSFEGTMEALTEQEAMEEHFFLGLRKMEGVSLSPYEQYYETLVEKLKNEGLMEQEGNKIFLTDRGIDVSNYCMAQFLLDEEG